MTIKKIGISALTAGLVTTASIAGTLSLGTGSETVSSELLSAQAVEVGVTSGFTFKTSGMVASSATEPAFELTLGSGITPTSLTGDLNVTRCDDNATSVANFDRIDGSSVIFSTVTGTTIERNVDYCVVTGGSSVISGNELNITMAQNASSAAATVKLYDNTGVNTLDSATANVLTSAAQFSGAWGTKLNAQIDASTSFLLFNAAPTTTDTYTFSITEDGTVDHQATLTGASVIVYPDQNVSTYTLSAAETNSSTGVWTTAMTTALNDLNLTATGLTASTNTASSTYTQTVVLTVAPTAAMGVVNFTADAAVTFTGGSKSLFSSEDAGAWTIYGYTAQIPNVSGLATHDTTMKFTNRSSLNTNIYFTLIDPDGTVVTLDSVTNTSLSALNAGVTGTYKASALIALVTDTDFDATGSFSVEVSIPTTPNSVYGMASFKNTNLGQFKDLPVYNSSTMSY